MAVVRVPVRELPGASSTIAHYLYLVLGNSGTFTTIVLLVARRLIYDNDLTA
jgi:hypothetical protein